MSRPPNGKRLPATTVKSKNYLVAKNTTNAVIDRKLTEMFDNEYNREVVLHILDALELKKGKNFGCFLILSFFCF